MIEVFKNRIEFSNVGSPLVPVERIVDTVPVSRNENLAGFMHKCGICEDAPYYMYRAQAIILSKLGKTKEAIKAAETSLQKAKKAGNEDYVKMNQDSISQWKKKR